MGKERNRRKGSKEESQVGVPLSPRGEESPSSHPGTAPRCYLSPVQEDSGSYLSLLERHTQTYPHRKTQPRRVTDGETDIDKEI